MMPIALYSNVMYMSDIVHLGIYSKSPYYMGAKLWNALPNEIKTVDDKERFKNCIKTYVRAHE